MATGLYSLEDLLNYNKVSVIDFDEARVNQIIQNDLTAYNSVIADMTGSLMITTTERVMTYGAGTRRRMKKLDEFGRVPTQRTQRQGGTYGVPLELYGDGLGWTKDYLYQVTPADLANRVLEIQEADRMEMYSAASVALFNPTSYTFYDYFIDGAELNVKRLLNGDGQAIPQGPFGEQFNAATHTHYLANASLTAAKIDEAISTVREHGHTGRIVIYINSANQSAIEGLAEFAPAQNNLLIYGDGVTRAAITLDNSRDDDREIGVWRGQYIVSTKPWVPANYLFAYDILGEKPLAMRIPAQSQLQGLRLVAQFDVHPLRADLYEHRFGVGVASRSNGAVLQFNNGTYTAPPVL